MHVCYLHHIHVHVCLSMHGMSLEGFTRKQRLSLRGDLEGGTERGRRFPLYAHRTLHHSQQILSALPVCSSLKQPAAHFTEVTPCLLLMMLPLVPHPPGGIPFDMATMDHT